MFYKQHRFCKQGFNPGNLIMSAGSVPLFSQSPRCSHYFLLETHANLSLEKSSVHLCTSTEKSHNYKSWSRLKAGVYILTWAFHAARGP